MQEAEITINYQPIWINVVNKLSVILIPAQIIFFVWSTLALLLASGVSGSGVMMLIFSQLLLVVLSCLFYIASSDRDIYVTRDGLFLPVLLAPSLASKTRYDWNQLRKVEYLPGSKGLGFLVLTFSNSLLPVKIDLKKIPENSTDNLMVAIDVWGGGSDNFPALLEVRSNLKDMGGKNKQLSYTEMWEEELTRRFGATNFIPLEPGDLVGSSGFEVERQIAFGGMSAIYQVKDLKEGRTFILKESVVPDDGISEMMEQAKKLLSREAKMLSGIDHPRIARIFDHFVENNRDYLLIEHLTGQDLRRIVKEYGAQKVEGVVDWGIQIGEIIKYLHSLNPPIIHKDLTPSNLILESDNLISLIDFGAANLFIGTATGTIIGKQSYIPPEQLRGKAKLASDIYSMGCTLYFLATGLDPEPISTSNPNAVLKVKIDERLNDLIIEMTSMEEDERPSIDAVVDRLKALGPEN